jgi:hypothetical protein
MSIVGVELSPSPNAFIGISRNNSKCYHLILRISRHDTINTQFVQTRNLELIFSNDLHIAHHHNWEVIRTIIIVEGNFMVPFSQDGSFMVPFSGNIL